MRQFIADRLLTNVQLLFSIRNGLLKDSIAPISDRHARILLKKLAELKDQCDGLELPFIGSEIERLILELKMRTVGRVSQSKARAAIDSIHNRMVDVFKDAVFLNVSAAKARYHSAVIDADASWEKRTIDASIMRAFPSAVPELTAAFDCYATENNTACVFHLMRAAEHGLRAFAVAVGVQTTASPLEYQQWQRLLEQAEARIKNAGIGSWSQPAKGLGLDFFQATVADYRALKDSVRNLVMHTRPTATYDEHQALSTMNRVQECLARLATYVQEGDSQTLLHESVFTEASAPLPAP